MEINTALGCCSLIEICYFDSTTTADRILNALKDHYEYEFEWDGVEQPYAMFATTKSSQREAEAALKELKFKPTRFKSRHWTPTNPVIITHWFRKTPPTKIAQLVRNLRKRKQA